VVLSAMSGITNGLIDCAKSAQAGDYSLAAARLTAIQDRHIEVVEDLIPISGRDQLVSALETDFSRLSILLQGITYLGELSKRSLDAISSCGEILSTKIFSAYAISQKAPAVYLDARTIMLTNEDYGKAIPNTEELALRSQKEIAQLMQEGKWIITQGFIGATASGVTTTLGRGGSDYTAALMGAAINADEIQIWTDVDGMMSADPRLVPEAVPVASVTFQEASELAYFGAKVLHPLTIKPAIEKNIPVRILNTLNPDSPGTLIVEKTENTEKICAIACRKGQAAIFINSAKMLMASGFLAQVFNIFARHETSIDLITTSEVSVSLTIDNLDKLPPIKEELEQFGEVTITKDLAIIALVGRNFREESGIAYRIFKALEKLNVIMISFGASDINISIVVQNNDADQAIKLLHAEFFSLAAVHS
jgi:aspartate kinase